MAARVYTEDVGTKIKVETEIDLTTATVTKLFVKEPDNSLQEYTAEIEDAVSGILYYLKTATSFDQVGAHTVYPYVEFGTDKWYGKPATLTTFLKGT